MSAHLPALTGQEVIAILRRRGFVPVRQSGSHVILHHADGRRTTVPVHAGRTLGRGLLRKTQQPTWRRKLERAYAKPTYKEAKAALAAIRRELVTLNESAARSLDEGLEETLTLHKLGVIATLGISLRTTNGIESIA